MDYKLPHTHQYRVICLIARQCGINLLDYLLRHPNIYVVGVFTHSRKPFSEDPNRSEREGFSKICKLLEDSEIPLHIVNTTAESKQMDGLQELGKFDFLLSLSWRFFVHADILKCPQLAAINLHRGLLPQYRGAEPIRRMLEDGLEWATITAHKMVEEIDGGEILQEDHLKMNTLPEETTLDAVERIKKLLDPIYPYTALKAMNQILQSRGLPLLAMEDVKL